MGIKNLLPLLKNVSKKKHLKDFHGETAAIDASCWLHKALSVSYNHYIFILVNNTCFPIFQMSYSSLIRNVLISDSFTVYTKEHESDTELSQIDYESGT